MTQLSEATFQDSNLPQRIDRNAGIIRRVKVLGIESANGRTYPLQVMRDSIELYRGVKVNIDHPVRAGEERSYTSGFGELRDPMVESDGMYADLHYNRKHPNAEQILEDCERFPTSFGMSHNAEGEVDLVDGKQIVESLAYVESVDVVGQPATNSGIWESKNTRRKLVMKKTIKRIIEDAPKKTKGLRGLMEQVEEGLLDEETIIDVPIEAAGGEVASVDGAEGEVKAALKSAVLAAFDDTSLDLTATLNAIKTILKAHEDIIGPVGEGSSDGESESSEYSSASDTSSNDDDGAGNGESEEGDETGTDEEVKESLKRKLQATTLLASAGISLSKVKVKALAMKGLNNNDRKELLESWKYSLSDSSFSGRPSNSPRKGGRGVGTFAESIESSGGFAKAVK